MVTTVQKKIFRDILEARKSLITIVCICALGIALFSGINLYISALENDLNDYYSEFNLADHWIYKNDMTNRDAEKIKQIKEVKDVQLRKTFDVELPNVNDATIRIHAFNGNPQINVPDVLEGKPLAQDDDRGILLDSRFAEENNIAVGDRLDFYVGEGKQTFHVRGIARNAENTYYAPEGLSVPDHKQYGFAYANADAFPDMPMNEMTMTTEEHKSLKTETIRHQLGFAAVVDRAHQSSYEYIQEDVNNLKPLATLFSLAFF